MLQTLSLLGPVNLRCPKLPVKGQGPLTHTPLPHRDLLRAVGVILHGASPALGLVILYTISYNIREGESRGARNFFH